jgi:hypothetical protein
MIGDNYSGRQAVGYRQLACRGRSAQLYEVLSALIWAMRSDWQPSAYSLNNPINNTIAVGGGKYGE